MKKLFTLLYIVAVFSAKADYWTQKADFGGIERFAAVGFSIGTKGYIGMGKNDTTFLNDFWEYDPSLNIWTQKADLGNAGRLGAAGFSIGNNGYIGLGRTLTGIYQEFWEYNPITNTWTQKADFAGPREFVVSFSIGGKGYVGTGAYGALHKDFWEYDPSMNTWTQKANFGGGKRIIASGFSDGIKGYLGMGVVTSANWVYHKDFWEWDPNTNVWTQKANFGGTARYEATAFWLCPFGYIGLGTTQVGSGTVPDFWKYDIANNIWSQVSDFGPGLRELAASFTIGNKGYIGTGWINDHVLNTFKDFWEYTPDSGCATGIEELVTSNLQFTISPNPAKDFITINYPLTGKEKINLTITDANGKKVFEKQLETKTLNFKLQTLNFPDGIYFVELNNGKEKMVKKFVKE